MIEIKNGPPKYHEKTYLYTLIVKNEFENLKVFNVEKEKRLYEAIKKTLKNAIQNNLDYIFDIETKYLEFLIRDVIKENNFKKDDSEYEFVLFDAIMMLFRYKSMNSEEDTQYLLLRIDPDNGDIHAQDLGRTLYICEWDLPNDFDDEEAFIKWKNKQ